MAVLPLATRGVPAESVEPTDSLIPKAKIGALGFLQEYPEYDGRGVIIAVFDGGVDPGAAGLQTTPEGRPKVLDLIDATGSGDVETTTIVGAVDGVFQGLSGRTLRPDPRWRNPTGKFRLGLKFGYELFPKSLIDRLQSRNRQRWEESLRPLEARLQKSIVEWKAGHPAPTPSEDHVAADLEARLDQLRGRIRDFDDPGSVFDCVVFHDGNVWRAAVDTDEDGDLGDETALTSYRVERQHASFGGETELNFSVNLEPDGKLLSIVTSADVHGTHLAGIAAGHFPGQPERNGIAPGAQLVSVKTVETRHGVSSTSGALARAVAAARRWKCDVVNLSMGGPMVSSDRGRLIELFEELVVEDGVVFVAAAGNAGPALTTVGYSAGASMAVISVGNYRTPAMFERLHGAPEAGPEGIAFDSARGPTVDGDPGIPVVAPGAAASPVPTWSLSPHRTMQGTSMACPNAAGAIALLLSGLKAEKLTSSPMLIRRALENTARSVRGVTLPEQGCGLIQVDRAFELARELARAGATEPRFKLTVSPEAQPGRGVYLRESHETSRVLETRATVEPAFREASGDGRQIAYLAKFRSESTAPLVRTDRSLLVAHGDRGGNDFSFSVDPTSLGTGLHAAEILGFEEGHVDFGPAFRIPVTVIRPTSLANAADTWSMDLNLPLEALERRFITVPASATWAELRARQTPVDSGTRPIVGVRTLQLRPCLTPDDESHGRGFMLPGGRTESVRFPVLGGRTLELVVSHVARESSPVRVSLPLEFHGITPTVAEAFLDGGAQVVRLGATSNVRPTRLEPKATLRARRRTVQPSRAEMAPLPDTRRDGRPVYELILTYAFAMDSPRGVRPRFPACEGKHEDRELDARLWMLTDGAKRLLAVDFPDEPRLQQLGKGEHFLRFSLRHDRLDWLEESRTLSLLLEENLAQEINLAAYADAEGSGRPASPPRRREAGSPRVGDRGGRGRPDPPDRPPTARGSLRSASAVGRHHGGQVHRTSNAFRGKLRTSRRGTEVELTTHSTQPPQRDAAQGGNPMARTPGLGPGGRPGAAVASAPVLEGFPPVLTPHSSTSLP